ncbi:MAG: 3-isopropylmalate dehydratase large subunit [Oscillospiraceae bacterium]|nr:3-isopropylmalate dehydratase large subunit [Oscillospiraceae bacterium]
MGKTLFDKIWDLHVVEHVEEGIDLLAIDRIFVHDLCGTFATQMLRDNGYTVRRTETVVASPDHTVASCMNRTGDESPESRSILPRFRRNCKEFGIDLYDIGDPRQGIIHIIGPEQGWSLPGMTLLCGDSHTCTHGALGCLAMGVGANEVYIALATSCLKVKKPKRMRVNIEGTRGPDVGPMDIILSIIAANGVSRGTGYAVEYCGSVVENMTMDERFTLCNLTIEMGAEYALIAPDQVTFDYIRGREHAPKEDQFDAFIEHCVSLRTDPDAVFDDEIYADITGLGRVVTWGVNPGQAIMIEQPVPAPDDNDEKQVADFNKAYKYMGYGPGFSMKGMPIGQVFIGACSNGRLSHLKTAAEIVHGHHVAEGVNALVVPGSEAIRKEAEELGLDKVFIDAGFTWGSPGCSLCVVANGERLAAGVHCVSTTNRNFMNRQGIGACTHLASPITAAMAAINGFIS